MSAGKIALEETAKKFADMTASEVKIGFGDLFCDHRSPLGQVQVFKDGEKELDETAKTLLEGAKAKHKKTANKKALDKQFYGIEDTETVVENEPVNETDDTPPVDPEPETSTNVLDSPKPETPVQDPEEPEIIPASDNQDSLTDNQDDDISVPPDDTDYVDLPDNDQDNLDDVVDPELDDTQN